MASPVEDFKCVPWFQKYSMSAVTLQRRFPTVFARERQKKRGGFASGLNCLTRMATFAKGKGPGRRPVSEAQVDTIRAAFACIPRKSTRHGARLLNMPYATVCTNLREGWKFLNIKTNSYIM
jgi:hypothetical protein